MNFYRISAVFGVALLAGISLGDPARSQSGFELALDSHFNSYKSCYGRVYSSEHLRKHPRQKVREITLSHFPNRQEMLGMDSPYQPYPDTPRLVLRISVLVDGESYHDASVWTDEALCEPDGKRLHCSLECDAGRFYVESRKGSLLITGGGDLYFDQCDSGQKVLMRQPDDKSFLLHPLPLSHCSPD